MFIEQEKEYVHYAMSLSEDGAICKTLEIQGPFRADDTDEYLDRYARFLERHLAADSAHWRIWRAEHQLWNHSGRNDDHQ